MQPDEPNAPIDEPPFNPSGSAKSVHVPEDDRLNMAHPTCDVPPDATEYYNEDEADDRPSRNENVKSYTPPGRSGPDGGR